MTGNPTESAPFLAGLEMPAPVYGGPGYVEQAMQRQIEAMHRSGDVDDRHAGALALAMVAARQIDTMGGAGRPSGRAMMLQAVVRVMELLPEVENASEDTLGRLTAELDALARQQRAES